MKKIITLMLLVMGFVGTASAYFSLPGTWDGWTTTSHQFENNTVVISLNGNTYYEFKFYNSDGNSWTGAGNNWSNTVMTYNNCSNWGLNSNEKNVSLLTTISGDYTFTLNWDNTTPLISVTYPTTYTRTVTSGNYGTICLPYAANITGATIFSIVSTIGSGNEMTGINIESVDNNIEAGKPYIFKATGSTLTATLSGNPVETATAAANGMVGNLSSSPANVTNGNYVLSQNKLRKVNGGSATVAQYRAYITLDGIGTATTRGANFISFDDNTTGIEDILQAGNSQKDAVYNLQGQRVMDNQKGLLIVNGKKVLQK